MIFEYQEKKRYFAQAGKGLEQLAITELEELGATDCSKGYCGVYFTADQATLYRINYCARIITRVLAPLISFPCQSDKVLYKKALTVDWPEIFKSRQSFAVFASVTHSNIKHSKFASLRLKDAIADHFRFKFNTRPNVDAREPDVWINLNIHNDQALISLDTSGGSLHRRGYRKESVAAPIQETLAAAIVRLSGWLEDERPKPFLDPMCGSGTIVSEALMAYCRIPASFKRKQFGFFFLPDFDVQKWADVKNKCDEKIRECPTGLIKAGDSDLEAVEAAIKNLREIPGGFRVQVRHRDFRKIKSAEDHLIVTNPPYGSRIGDVEQLKPLFKDMGDFLKNNCKGTTAYILAGDKELSKAIGLRISRRIPLFNGPLEVRLVQVNAY